MKMIDYNIRSLSYSSLGLAFSTYIVIFLLTQDLGCIDFSKALSHISTTISINIVIWAIFIKKLWKLKLFYPWLVQVPDLSGDWQGELKSNWDDSKKELIPIKARIRQTFLNIQVEFSTDESRSYSIGASFNICIQRGQEQLIYTYLNTPRAGVRDRSEIHYGSAILEIDGFKNDSLIGEYWTSRETYGEITLRRNNSS
jgi:hypothetical protein